MRPGPAELLAMLRQRGPIPIHDYMDLCLRHYYARPLDPLGQRGDFITAPEISQIFGELIGLWARYQWQQLGLDGPLRLVEYGPGRGTLMADAVRAISQTNWTPGFEFFFAEVNPVLRAQQQQNLSTYHPQWLDENATLPPGPCIIIANEFLDALPIHQAVFDGQQWRERLIDYRDDFCVIPGAVITPPALPASPPKPGDIIEFAPTRTTMMQHWTTHLAQYGGAMVIIDYGYLQVGYGDTIQAIKAHQKVNFLTAVGEADITAHVDFAALRNIARTAGLSVEFFGTQGDFLRGLGINQRLQKLRAHAPQQAHALTTAAERLIDPTQMGDLFKVLTASTAPPKQL